jgi:hypothetical protein
LSPLITVTTSMAFCDEDDLVVIYGVYAAEWVGRDMPKIVLNN